MSERHNTIDIPSAYWITETTYRCNVCAVAFKWNWAEGGEVVKFVNADGKVERWLPTYGANGYLELLESLVPGFSREQEITHAVSNNFREAFTAVQNESGVSPVYSVDDRSPVCPVCGARDLDEISREVKVSPPVTWLNLE